MLSLFLMILALVLFLIAGSLVVTEPWRSKLVCYGLASLTGAFIVSNAVGLKLFG